ncbi:MAG: hypothetical protein QMD92_05185 [bacterium]|nr:hypothetical protein [bacterium]
MKNTGKRVRKKYEDKYSPLKVVKDYENIILKLYKERIQKSLKSKVRI